MTTDLENGARPRPDCPPDWCDVCDAELVAPLRRCPGCRAFYNPLAGVRADWRELRVTGRP